MWKPELVASQADGRDHVDLKRDFKKLRQIMNGEVVFVVAARGLDFKILHCGEVAYAKKCNQ